MRIIAENNNLTLAPHASRHFSYLIESKLEPCSAFLEKYPKDRCAFMNSLEDCKAHGLIDYKYFVYCTLKPDGIGQDLAIMLLLMVFIIICFMFLACTTEEYFCPSLKASAKVMHLNETVTGVTLLAFGNGSPDILTSISQTSASCAKLFTELIAGSMVVTIAVGGIVILVHPFQVAPFGVTRDILFLSFSILAVEYVMDNGTTITLFESCMLLLLYLVYVAIVIVDSVLLTYTENQLIRQLREAQRQRRGTNMRIIKSELEIVHSELEVNYGLDIKTSFDLTIIILLFLWRATVSFHHEELGRHYLFQQFLMALNPVNLKELSKKSKGEKVWTLLRAPFQFILTFIIPYVNLDEERNGWCKLLNCIHLITLPTFCLLMEEVFFEEIVSRLPVYAVSVPICFTLAITAFFTSNTYASPKFHIIYYFMAIFGSVYLIFKLAQNVVAILEVIGFVTNLSKSFLGITFLAIGNALGDLVANITLAKSGFHRMALAASFGGPVFNVAFGFAITYLIKAAKSKNLEFFSSKGSLGVNCSFILLLTLITFLGGLALCGFVARKPLGVYCLSMFILCMLIGGFTEFGLSHAFGADHSLDTTN